MVLIKAAAAGGSPAYEMDAANPGAEAEASSPAAAAQPEQN